jgi:DNA-binding NarL/FixJ family response regulator
MAVTQAGAPDGRETVEIVSDQRLLVEGLARILGPHLAPPRSARVSRTDKERIVVLDATLDDASIRCADLVRDGRSVILLGVADDECALAALRAGVRGVLGREAGGDELSRAIRVVANGQLWAPRRLLARALSLLSSTPASPGASGSLTRREEQIVGHALGGLSNKEIADRLAIRPCTVKAHLTSVFRKLSVRDRTQLVVRYGEGHTALMPPLGAARRALVRARTILGRQLVLLLTGLGLTALACGASAPRDEAIMTAPPPTPAAGRVEVRAGATAFPAGAVVAFSVANGLASSVYTEDEKSGCAIVVIERERDDGWEPILGCNLERLAALVEIPPGKVHTGTIDPRSTHFDVATSGSRAVFGPGNYRLRFGYRPERGPEGEEPSVVYSPTFRIGP